MLNGSQISYYLIVKTVLISQHKLQPDLYIVFMNEFINLSFIEN